MNKINKNHIELKKWFTVESDPHMCTCAAVGTDTEGIFIYESSIMDNRGAAYFMRSAYYSISLAEFEQYAKRSLENGYITHEQYKNLLKQAKDISK